MADEPTIWLTRDAKGNTLFADCVCVWRESAPEFARGEWDSGEGFDIYADDANSWRRVGTLAECREKYGVLLPGYGECVPLVVTKSYRALPPVKGGESDGS